MSTLLIILLLAFLIFLVLIIIYTMSSSQKKESEILKVQTQMTHPIEEPQGIKSNVAVLMINVGYPPGIYSRKMWKQYSKIHRYDFIELIDSDYDDKSIGIAWWRIRKVKELLNKYEYVMHVDADMAPIDLSVSIDKFIKQKGSQNTIGWFSGEHLHSRWNRGCNHFRGINFGVFILKDDSSNHKLLEEVWKERYSRTTWPREQGAIEDYLCKNISTEHFNDRYVVIPVAQWQIMGTNEDDSPNDCLEKILQNKEQAWIYHGNGLSMDQISNLMKCFCDYHSIE